MEEMRDQFFGFISNNLLIKDDSCTIGALEYAPYTNEFKEISDMLYAAADELRKNYIDPFPVRPELPDAEADVNMNLRKLYRGLAGTGSFITGLCAYIEKQVNQPSDGITNEPAQQIMDSLRARLEQNRREARSECEMWKYSMEDAERRLRSCIAGLRHIEVREERIGNNEYMLKWDWHIRRPDAERVSGLMQYLYMAFCGRHKEWNQFQGYRQITEKMVGDIEAGVHDMVLWVNSASSRKMNTVFTSYTQKYTVSRPLDPETQKSIFDMIVNDGPSPRTMLPDLRLSVDDLQNLFTCANAVRACRAVPEPASPDSIRITLTEAECERIRADYSLGYARQIIMGWYEKHERCDEIEISENALRKCESKLKECWDIDEQCRSYNSNYLAFKEQVMELWHKYLTGHRKWDTVLELPQSQQPSQDQQEHAPQEADDMAETEDMPETENVPEVEDVPETEDASTGEEQDDTPAAGDNEEE